MTVDLSLAALDMLREDLKLGSWPFPLEIPAYGETTPERARIKSAVYADLERRGLAKGRRVEPELAGKLSLVARPTISIDAVAVLDMNAPAALKAVVVATGKRALLVVQHDLKVSITPIRDTALASSIVEVIPQANAAVRGTSVSLPVDALNRGKPQGDDVAKVAYVASVMQKPVLRAGQFGLTIADPNGHRVRLPGIGWFDNESGRYMNLVRPSGDGAAWLTMAPADGPRIAHRISEELLTALRR